MTLPRDISGRQPAKLVESLGCAITRQKGSHMRLTTTQHGEQCHRSCSHLLRIGTLRSILTDVAAHFGMTRDDLVERLFGTSS